MDIKKCIHLHAKTRWDSNYCPDCGEPLCIKCGNCNVKQDKNNKFCISCGSEIKVSLNKR